MTNNYEQLEKILVHPGYINKNDFEFAKKEATKKRINLVDVLIEKNLIKDEQFGQVYAQTNGHTFINLRKEKIDEAVLKRIPEVVARSKGVIGFAADKAGVRVGMADPDDLEMKHILEKKYNKKIIPYYITNADLQESLANYRGGIKEEVDVLLGDIDSKPPVEEKDKKFIRLVDLLFEKAYQDKASDIHIEPREEKAYVRFRIDGVLHTVIMLEKKYLDPIVTRIKILAKLRIDEHRSSQDGKLVYEILNKKIDIRVSVVPVLGGENVVMRILSSKNRAIGIDSLGMSDLDLAKIQKVIRNPQGMVLVTGPTGCGKTTTVYEILKLLNTDRVHIASIEDPVEYNIEGVSQIQVDAKTNMNFASGLRAIVRQDPDIIMVGEIRDTETVKIAINSAMTGHLVLSTIHANDAATTFPRLIDMGIEPYLIVSTVNVVISQRLVRTLCPKCLFSYTLSSKEKNAIKKNKEVMEAIEKHKKDIDNLLLYKSQGCKACGESGYQGRIGIFEVIEMTDQIKQKILDRSSGSQINQAAQEKGMISMLEDGLNKAFNGLTTIDEILRVTTG